MKLKEVRKKPYTNAELFTEIVKMIELPDNLDYYLGADDELSVKTYAVNVSSDLNYGGSEGIYLRVGLYYNEMVNGRYVRREVPLGVFKTLDTSAESMRKMAILLADFTVATGKFINMHLDDFEWTGYTVYGTDETGDEILSCYSKTYQSMERVNESWSRDFASYPGVLIVDNATKLKTVIKRSKTEDGELKYAI